MTRKRTVSVSEFARLRGVSAQAVRDAIKTGRITVQPGRRVDPVAAAVEWDESTDPRKGKGPAQRGSNPQKGVGSNGSSGTLPSRAESERTRSHFRAEREKLAAELEAGLLVRVADIERAVGAKVRRTRDRLLGIADRVDALLAAETSPEACNQIVATEIERALTELAGPERRTA